jgi:arsenate reductase
MFHRSRVLFICVHNAARSQMCEALLKHYGGGRFDVQSAGLEAGELNPLAVEVLAEIGIDISQNQTKSVFDAGKSGEVFGYVIAGCDAESAVKCPIFPGLTKRLHWPFHDPLKLRGTHEQQLQKVREIRDEIAGKIQDWLACLPVEQLA